MRLRATLTAVALCFAASLGFCAAGCFRGEPLPHVARVPQFALHDQNARALSPEQLRGDVWIANFMFTSCPDVCPFLTSKMSGVRTQLAPVRDQLHFVSFSVDPEHDTPAVLKQYAQKHGADQPDWSFLTGPVDQVKRVVVEGFKVSLQLTPAESGKANAILHGSHFVLVDRELDIRGFYPSDEEGLLRLQRDARILVAEKKKPSPS
jgi:protein SCO1/2